MARRETIHHRIFTYGPGKCGRSGTLVYSADWNQVNYPDCIQQNIGISRKMLWAAGLTVGAIVLAIIIAALL